MDVKIERTDLRMICDEAEQLAGSTREHRRRIHACPELSFEERATADYVISVLEAEGIACRRIAGTGVLARIEGRGELRRAVVLRADMDALPIEERSDLPFASQNRGVMHACGHDMHTAALLGALTLLNRRRTELQGTLFGLFQPGEEVCPGGASMVLKEHPFEGYDVIAMIGEHVDPDLPTGVFGFRAGKYMASSDELRITVMGEGGHGAMPDRLHDPVVAAAAVITALQQVVSRNADSRMPTVLSIGRVVADGATNVIPDRVLMEGTLRTFDETWRAEAKRRVHEIAEHTAAAYGTTAEVAVSDGYPCVVNDPRLTDCAERLIASMFGSEHTVRLELRPTAEDFGYYTQVYPSLFYRLGVGGSDPVAKPVGKLHTATFAPDEEALSYAVAALSSLSLQLLRCPDK